MRAVFAACALAALLSLPGGALYAQDRPLPEGAIRAGGYALAPSLTLETLYDDNVYRRDGGGPGDMIGIARPALMLMHDGRRHDVRLGAQAEIGRYAAEHALDYTDYSFAGDGRYAAGREGVLTASAARRRLHLARGGAADLETSGERPGRVTVNALSLGFEQGQGLLNWAVKAMRDITATRSDGREAERRRNALAGELAYSYFAGNTLFAEGEVSRTAYDLPGRASGRSDGAQVKAGLRIDPARNWRAELYAAYLYQGFENGPDARMPYMGFRLDYDVTRLSRLSVQAGRRIDLTGSSDVAASARTVREVTLNHQVTPRLDLSFNGGYDDIDYLGPGAGNRAVHVLRGGAEAVYEIDSGVDVRLGYDYTARRDDAPGAGYTDNRVVLSLRLSP